GQVRQIKAVEPYFTLDGFIAGAKKAFEMIVTAFVKGDRETLRQMLDNDVYDRFTAAIDAREQAENTEETTLVSINSAKVEEISLNRKIARIVVEFVSEQISVTRNREGKIVEGDPSHIERVADRWVFSRKLGTGNPNWELVATQ